MCQLMKARLFAFTDIGSVVRADLHPAPDGVSMAAAPATHNCYGVRVWREGCLEPLHLLDGMDINRAMPIGYYSIIHYKHCAG
jgi:hypothetical protein